MAFILSGVMAINGRTARQHHNHSTRTAQAVTQAVTQQVTSLQPVTCLHGELMLGEREAEEMNGGLLVEEEGEEEEEEDEEEDGEEEEE